MASLIGKDINYCIAGSLCNNQNFYEINPKLIDILALKLVY